jgi:hypothetical protein
MAPALQFVVIIPCEKYENVLLNRHTSKLSGDSKEKVQASMNSSDDESENIRVGSSIRI